MPHSARYNYSFCPSDGSFRDLGGRRNASYLLHKALAKSGRASILNRVRLKPHSKERDSISSWSCERSLKVTAVRSPEHPRLN